MSSQELTSEFMIASFGMARTESDKIAFFGALAPAIEKGSVQVDEALAGMVAKVATAEGMQAIPEAARPALFAILNTCSGHPFDKAMSVISEATERRGSYLRGILTKIVEDHFGEVGPLTKHISRQAAAGDTNMQSVLAAIVEKSPSQTSEALTAVKEVVVPSGLDRDNVRKSKQNTTRIIIFKYPDQIDETVAEYIAEAAVVEGQSSREGKENLAFVLQNRADMIDAALMVVKTAATQENIYGCTEAFMAVETFVENCPVRAVEFVPAVQAALAIKDRQHELCCHGLVTAAKIITHRPDLAKEFIPLVKTALAHTEDENIPLAAMNFVRVMAKVCPGQIDLDMAKSVVSIAYIENKLWNSALQTFDLLATECSDLIPEALAIVDELPMIGDVAQTKEWKTRELGQMTEQNSNKNLRHVTRQLLALAA